MLPSAELRGIGMGKIAAQAGRGGRGLGRGRSATSLPVLGHLRCDACGHEQPLSGLVRRVTATGAPIPLCYACYEARTGGAYFGQDEYWDGWRWIPLAEGE